MIPDRGICLGKEGEGCGDLYPQLVMWGFRVGECVFREVWLGGDQRGDAAEGFGAVADGVDIV